MSDDLAITLISGILGAAIALIFRELFAWKGQGRIEAIRKYDLLKTECYGILLPLLSRMEVRVGHISIKSEEYSVISEKYGRFSHRFTFETKEKLKDLIYGSRYEEGSQLHGFPDSYTLSLHDITGGEFMENLINNLKKEEEDILKKIEELESISQSFCKKICYNLKFWSDVS